MSRILCDSIKSEGAGKDGNRKPGKRAIDETGD